MKILHVLSMIVLILVTAMFAFGADSARIEVDLSQKISTVPDLYNVGYNGWGDIIYPSAVKHLNDVDVKYCRVIAQLSQLCGDKPGEYNWEYTTPQDIGVGFVSRVKKIIQNGWTPVIAFSLHEGERDLPKWFNGENNDKTSKAWFRYNTDGTMNTDGRGNQCEAISKIAYDTVKKFSDEGLKGLFWETIYEMGADMPIDDIHYYVAKGIREADPTAKIVGPATWPGWTVEERFVKPFFAKYDADLIDYVSLHWYGSNEHELWDLGFDVSNDVITMKDTKYLDYLLGMTPKYAAWVSSLRALLDDPKLNPKGKKIGIMYTEYDAVAQSPYGRNPENPDWPKYNPATDCYVNTNYFGGVWCASVLCNLAANGNGDAAFKFNTRNFYGLIENGEGKNFYRQPIWFAWKLLQEKGGLKSGASLVKTKADNPSALVESYAVKAGNGTNIILINKSWDQVSRDVMITGLRNGSYKVTRYVFDRTRTANFIGRKPGTSEEGRFEGAPVGDAKNLKTLVPIESIRGICRDNRLLLSSINLSPISITVMQVRAEKK